MVDLWTFLKNPSKEICSNEIRISREPSVRFHHRKCQCRVIGDQKIPKSCQHKCKKKADYISNYFSKSIILKNVGLVGLLDLVRR